MEQQHLARDCGCQSDCSCQSACGCEEPGGGKWLHLRLLAGGLSLAAGMALEHFTEMSQYGILAIYLTGYLLLGGEVVLNAARNIARGKVFDENFLMAVATISAFAIGECAEALGVMLFYQVGELLQGLAVQKSRRTIAKLMDIRSDFANLQSDGELIRVPPVAVNIGDVIVVKPGEKIPLDGMVTDGEANIDTSFLTGESVPKKAATGDAVLAGCINLNGVLTVSVTRSFGESAVSRIINLVENAAEKKAPTEKFITKFARYYTPAVVCMAALIAVLPPLLLSGGWLEWLHRGLIFLVISCPCALVVSIPVGFYGGIGCASRNGILVKGGNYLETLNRLDTVVFDKTGTLTRGVFEVTAVHPENGYSKEDLIETAAMAEAFSNHPIAWSIKNDYGKQVDIKNITSYKELPGQGVSATANGIAILSGNRLLMENFGIKTKDYDAAGTKIFISSDGVFMGCIVISDELKKDSKTAVEALRRNGVRRIIMLTGDSQEIADAVSCELNIDCAYGGLMPWEKVEKIEDLDKRKAQKGKLAFVGDGINDAPALAMADVGVAMGGLGQDAAIEAADVVLMTDEPMKLAHAVAIAGRTKRIVWQNIIFALSVKAFFLLLGALGAINMWEAVFADVGVALLAILNAMRVMSYKIK